MNELIEKSKSKSRHLPLYDFLKTLQLEYICFKLRSQIYPIPTHKNFWKGVMEKKRRTIEEVSGRNQLPTIFNDAYIEGQIMEEFYINSIPNFLYRNDEFRKKWEYWDLYNYYLKNSQVRVDTDSGSIVSNIVSYEPFSNYLYVHLDNINTKVPINKVHRIL